jgi:hypothetical protein
VLGCVVVLSKNTDDDHSKIQTKWKIRCVVQHPSCWHPDDDGKDTQNGKSYSATSLYIVSLGNVEEMEKSSNCPPTPSCPSGAKYSAVK